MNSETSPKQCERATLENQTNGATILITEADQSWLGDLSMQRVGQDQIAEANDLIKHDTSLSGKAADSEAGRAALVARSKFFGELLGMDLEDHPLHGAYTYESGIRGFMGPIATFVETQRYVDSVGLDNARLLSAFSKVFCIKASSVQASIGKLEAAEVDPVRAVNKKPHLLGMSPATLVERLDNLDSLEIDIPKMVGVFPAILTYKQERVANRIRAVRRVAKVLDWDEDPDILVERLPAIFGYSDQKLKVHARLLASHGSKAMLTSNVARMIIAPLDLHILALNSGQPYTANSLGKINKTIPSDERDAASL